MDIHLPRHSMRSRPRTSRPGGIRMLEPEMLVGCSSTIRGRVIRAGEEITLVSVPAGSPPADLPARVARIRVEIGHASIFEEGWMLTKTLLGDDSESQERVDLKPQKGRLPDF